MENMTRTFFLSIAFLLGSLTAAFATVASLPNSWEVLDEPNNMMCDGIFSTPEIICDGTTYVHFTTGGEPGTAFVVTAAGQSFVFQHGQPSYTITVDVNTPTFSVIFDDGITGCVWEGQFDAPCQSLACTLEQVTVVPTSCNPNNVYGVTVDFETTRPDLNYRVRVGTQTFGPFAYSAFPVTVGSIVGNTTATTPIRIWTEGEVCDYNTTITHACPQPCEIYQFNAYQSCEGGAFTVRVALGSNLPANSLVQILMNDVSLGTFAAGSFPRWFDLPFDIGQHVVFNLMAANADCQAETDLTVVSCDDLCDGFAITNVFAEPDPNMPGWLSVQFTVSGAGGGIPIVMTNPVFPNDGNQTIWWSNPQSTALFVPVSPGTFGTDLVFSTPFNNCSTTVTVAHEPVTCGGLESIVYQGTCTNASGYVVEIDIPNASANALYAILQNNAILGEFPGSAFPVTLSATPNADQVWSLTVSVLGTQCSEELTFQPANCHTGCELSDISVLPTPCNPNGVYGVTVDFETSRPDLMYRVRVGAQTYGPFAYGAFPVTVGSIVGNTNTPTNVRIWTEGEVCDYNTTVFQLCTEPCMIENFTATQICEGSMPYVRINFDSNLPENTPVQVLMNDVSVGTFAAGTFPRGFQLPFDSGQHVVFNLITANADCQAETDLTVMACPPNCNINEVNIYSEGCNDQGAYAISVNFNSDTHDVFDIWNQTTGQRDTILITELPFAFPPVPLGVNVSDIRIAPLGVTGDCVVEETFAYFCPPPSACGFTDIFAEAYACDGNQFLVDIQFENPNGGAAGFYIFGDGMIFGPFPYGQNFYTFGPLNSTQSAHSILMLDIANPACFGNYTLTYNCADACAVAVVATPQPCDGETFDVMIDVTGTNTGESFLIVGNGVNYGMFNYADLPIVLEGFPGDGQSNFEFGVIDLENPNCTAWTMVEAQDCRPCTMSGLEYTVTCGPEGFNLNLDFEVEHPASNQFALYLNGILYEWFLYEDLPLALNFIPYELAGGDIYIVDVEDSDCSVADELLVPCCHLGNAVAALSVLPCQDDGTYYLRVGEFAHFNTSDTLLIDYSPAGSSIIQTVAVAYTDLPTEMGPLQGNGTTNYIVVLRDSESNCAQQTIIEAVYCDNSTCMELEGIEGVFAPAFGQDNDTTITIENDIRLSYQRNPATACACNLFVTDGIPGVNFGSGHILATQNVGFGLHFGEVATSFNTVNIDYYYTGGNITVRVNNADAVTVGNIVDLPSAIAAGVSLQVTPNSMLPGTGLLTFTGEEISRIFIYTNESAAFDNICLSEDDNVWPGDTNADNIAHHIDLLNIGIAYGATGPARSSNTSEWTGLVSSNWGDFFADDVNFKHADANGDGVVDDADRAVLAQNYGLTHGEVTPFTALPYTDLDPALYIDNTPIVANTPFAIPVVAGTAEQPVENNYGIAFTLELDPTVFDMDNLEVVFPVSWFGEPGVNVITMHRIYADGRVEVALSRNDRNNVSGFGPILYLHGIIDDIAGTTPHASTDMWTEKIKSLNREGVDQPLRPLDTKLIITSTETPLDVDLLVSSLSVFPNPTQGQLFITNHDALPLDRLYLFNAAGQLVAEQKNPNGQLDIRHLPTGVYLLQIHVNGQIVTKKVVKTE